MLNNLKEQLWEAKYLNPVWPDDLVKNTKDPDYRNINFEPLSTGLKVTLTFQDYGDLVEAVYIFDSEDYIQRIYMFEPNGKSIIYDRDKKVEDLMAKILMYKDENLFVKAPA